MSKHNKKKKKQIIEYVELESFKCHSHLTSALGEKAFPFLMNNLFFTESFNVRFNDSNSRNVFVRNNLCKQQFMRYLARNLKRNKT